MSKTSILVIEDEADLRDGLRINLEHDGFRVATAANGQDGLAKATAGTHDLILLDLMLPDVSGLELLKHIRDSGDSTPVIILSAKGQDPDKIAGLDLGADDYLAKPFGLGELGARIRAVLRRTEARRPRSADILRFDGLTVDFRRHTVTRDGEEIGLSKIEADILRVLIAHRGEVVTREDLLRQVWGYVRLPNTRTVDNHIARLRKKLERDVDHPAHVVTVHGVGYRFDSEPLP